MTKQAATPRWWALGALVLLLGCGASEDEEEDEDEDAPSLEWVEACSQTCARLYDESECGLQSPGWTQEDLLGHCQDECGAAYGQPGEVRPTYTPNQYAPADREIAFTNEAEAELWMACIDETACALLAEGYCAPVW